MENEDLQDQVKHAVQMLFYGSPGSNEQQQADQWLSVFQTKEEAWKVALDLISSQTTEEVKFVASQASLLSIKLGNHGFFLFFFKVFFVRFLNYGLVDIDLQSKNARTLFISRRSS